MSDKTLAEQFRELIESRKAREFQITDLGCLARLRADEIQRALEFYQSRTSNEEWILGRDTEREEYRKRIASLEASVAYRDSENREHLKRIEGLEAENESNAEKILAALDERDTWKRLANEYNTLRNQLRESNAKRRAIEKRIATLLRVVEASRSDGLYWHSELVCKARALLEEKP